MYSIYSIHNIHSIGNIHTACAAYGAHAAYATYTHSIHSSTIVQQSSSTVGKVYKTYLPIMHALVCRSLGVLSCMPVGMV